MINDRRILFVFGWVPPFAIFLFKQSYDMLPNEYADAAKIDGAGTFTFIFRVYGPLLQPPMAALFVITFLTYWNDYLWPSLTITNHPDFIPIALRVAGIGLSSTSFAGPPNPAALMRILLALWPPALVYWVLQRYFVQGLVATGIKR